MCHVFGYLNSVSIVDQVRSVELLTQLRYLYHPGGKGWVWYEPHTVRLPLLIPRGEVATQEGGVRMMGSGQGIGYYAGVPEITTHNSTKRITL